MEAIHACTWYCYIKTHRKNQQAQVVWQASTEEETERPHGDPISEDGPDLWPIQQTSSHCQTPAASTIKTLLQNVCQTWALFYLQKSRACSQALLSWLDFTEEKKKYIQMSFFHFSIKTTFLHIQETLTKTTFVFNIYFFKSKDFIVILQTRCREPYLCWRRERERENREVREGGREREKWVREREVRGRWKREREVRERERERGQRLSWPSWSLTWPSLHHSQCFSASRSREGWRTKPKGPQGPFPVRKGNVYQGIMTNRAEEKTKQNSHFVTFLLTKGTSSRFSARRLVI